MKILFKFFQLYFVALIMILFMVTGCVSAQPASPETTIPPPPASTATTNGTATPANVEQTPVQATVITNSVTGFVYEAWEGGSQIYYMKKSNSDRVKLRQSGNSQPAWSSDRDTIAFVADKDGVNQIFTMDINGNNVTQRTFFEVNNLNLKVDALNPIWSPDSRKIAFYQNNSWPELTRFMTIYLASSIYVMNSDGTDLINLTEWRPDCLNLSPVWSPDGKKLTFISLKMGKDLGDKAIAYIFEYPDIFVINADGTGLSNLTNTLDESYISPIWSPDGQYIAFLSNKEGHRANSDYWNLYVMRNDGSAVTRLNTDASELTGYGGLSRNYGSDTIEWASMPQYYEPYITWSPDGKFITVCTVRAQGPIVGSAQFPTISKPPEQFSVGSLIIFDAKTGKEITAVKAAKRSVCWSPDSKRICYIPPTGSDASDQLVSYRKIKASSLVIMDPDGSNPQTIYDCNPEGYLNWYP